MPDAAHSSARLLAPLALLACTIALFVILLGSDASDDDSGNAAPAGEVTGTSETATTQSPRPQRRNYTVQTGDTLGGIAEKTGVEVERLQELNPELDPQALVAGQKIKLRE